MNNIKTLVTRGPVILIRHTFGKAVALFRANGHDLSLFEHPDGLQFQDGELIPWGEVVAVDLLGHNLTVGHADHNAAERTATLETP